MVTIVRVYLCLNLSYLWFPNINNVSKKKDFPFWRFPQFVSTITKTTIILLKKTYWFCQLNVYGKYLHPMFPLVLSIHMCYLFPFIYDGT